jgi:multiple sugar transport system substrate-binding protein
VMLCLLLIPMLCSCAQATPPAEPITIVFVHPEVDTEVYQTLAGEFAETHPSITVELRASTGTMWSALSIGETDVFVAAPYVLLQLLQQDQVLDLDPFIEQDRSFQASDFYPGTMDLLTFEGKTLAIPAGVDVLVMFYNKDLFDQHGVPYPDIGWTWDDFLSAGLAVTDPEAGVYGYTPIGTTNEPAYADAALFVYQHGGRLFDSLRDPTYTTFDDPLTIEAVEWYARLYDEYDIAPTPTEARKAFGTSQYAYYEGIRQGQVGMWIGEHSQRGGLGWPVDWFVDWGMVPLPRDVTSMTQADVEGYAIHAEAEHPDACWEWISFLSQHMPYRLMPARKELADSIAYGQLVGEDIAAVVRASMEDAVLINLMAFVEFEGDMDTFASAVREVIDGDSTAREAMDWAQQQAEQ